jgi:hypothetical protein
MVPLLLPFIAAVGLSPSPGEFLAGIALSMATPATSPGIVLIMLAVSAAIASWAAPRLTHGLTGWIRHLPLDAGAHRRATALALAVAQAPVLSLAALLIAGVLLNGTVPVSLVKVAGLPLMALGIAYAVLPVRRGWMARPLGMLAAILSLTSVGWELGAAILLIVAAELLSGPIREHRRSRRFRSARVTLLPALIAWRALGWRTLAAFPLPFLVLSACWLFISNNRLAGGAAETAVRLGGALATTVLFAGLSVSLATRRPAWPWARSLPSSSAQRVGADGLFFGIHALPLLLIASLLHPWAALAVLAGMPFLAVRAAGSMRAGVSDRAGAAGRVAAEGFFVSCLLAILPWTALLALACVPLALSAAARKEQELKVTRWSAIHHLAAGDSLSWSGQ